MLTNPVIETMLNRKSVRKYTDQKPSDEVIATVVRAGQQAPFAAQLCSLLLTGKQAPYGSPLWFTICVDLHRMEIIMAKREWTMVSNDLSMLVVALPMKIQGGSGAPLRIIAWMPGKRRR